MPKPGNCCGEKFLQENTDEQIAGESLEPAELLSTHVTRGHDDNNNLNLQVGKGCPKMEPCPGQAAIPREYEEEKGDGDKITLEKAKNLPPGPLGPIPGECEGNVPLDYWTPLGNLTKTRPAVENFSLSRFSQSEWREHNEKISKECRDGIQVAAIAGYNAQCSIFRAYAETDRNQIDNNLNLSMRAGIIYRWKTELENITKEISEEIDFVQEIKRRTMRAKSVLQLVENIGKDMTRVRCFRIENDLVRDQVAEEIIKELALCEEIKDVYIRLLDQIKMQIEELKNAKQKLDFDWSGKYEAYEIETDSRGLNSESSNILWKPGSVRIPPDQSSQSSYEYSISQLITEGEIVKRRSRTLRVNVDAIIEKAIRDLRDQADRTDLALTEQIQSHEEALRRLEVELNKDLQQISDIETLVDELRQAAKKLDGAMKCAQTRLDNRLHRNGVESCRDVPQFGLIDEVKSLSENVTATLSQLKRTEDSMAALIQTRKNIEKEMIVKRKSLYVDRERCQLLRTFYPSVQALAGN